MSYDPDEVQAREWLVEKRIDECMSTIHRLIFSDDLTAAESRWAWLQVIAQMVASAAIDRNTDVVVERMKL